MTAEQITRTNPKTQEPQLTGIDKTLSLIGSLVEEGGALGIITDNKLPPILISVTGYQIGINEEEIFPYTRSPKTWIIYGRKESAAITSTTPDIEGVLYIRGGAGKLVDRKLALMEVNNSNAGLLLDACNQMLEDTGRRQMQSTGIPVPPTRLEFATTEPAQKKPKLK